MSTVYFWHIPKTAGTAVSAALATNLAGHRLYPRNTLDGLWASDAPPARDASLFCGHFGAYLPAELDRVPEVVFTVLREPAEQAWSYYRFIQRIPEFAVPDGVQGCSLEELLDHPVYSRLFTNLQARWLALRASRAQWHAVPHISTFRHHSAFELQDLEMHGLGAEQVLLSEAQARLAAMTAVGTTDGLPALFNRLCERGLAVTWTGRRHNESPDDDPLPRALRSRLDAANTVDWALYAAAQS